MRRIRQGIALVIGLGLSFLWVAAAVSADKTWPREVKTDQGILTIYQPQPDTFRDNVLTGRAAVSLLKTRAASPIFGVFWFTSRVDIDRDRERSGIGDHTGIGRRLGRECLPRNCRGRAVA